MHFASVLTTALVAGIANAHPGHDPAKEMAERREFLTARKTNLSHCAEKIRERGLHSRAIQRRQNKADQLMEKRGLKKRQLSSLDESHASDADYTLDTDPATVFAENSCVLSPEVTEGPYYVAGEMVRTNVVEDQTGVPMAMDIQVLDTETCEPVVGAMFEIWHCNSTGVYGGVLAQGNGVGPDEVTNLQNTWLRGVQPTDDDGVVQFETLFPGHYSGRTTHIHVMVHLNTEANENGTLISTTAAHVGQMFFDQDLTNQVEQLSPYTDNQQVLTTNVEDFILAQEAATSDPIMSYSMLGDTLQDGLMAWLSFGIDTSYSTEVMAAATVYEDGAVMNENTGGFMGPPDGGFGPPPF